MRIVGVLFLFLTSCAPRFATSISSNVIPPQAARLESKGTVSHYGVTLHFSEDVSVGHFANGEPYIVLSNSGATVTGIDNPTNPSTSSVKGGAMLNPVPGGVQGYCPILTHPDNPVHYSAALDVSLLPSFAVNAGDSLMVARLVDNLAVTGNNYVETVVVFTFLAEAPPEGSFRPGLYGGNHKVQFNVNDINWSALKKLETVPLAFTQDYMENDVHIPSLPYWDWHGNWDGSAIRPFQNSGAFQNGLVGSGALPSNYGRDVAAKWSRVALWLNLDLPQEVKKKTLIHTIQVGLDVAAFLDQGLSYGASGGHQIGNKFPLLLASAVFASAPGGAHLVDLAAAPNRFVEDGTTFFISQNDVNLEHGVPSDPLLGLDDPKNFIQEDCGLPEWGIAHWWDRTKDDARFFGGVPYRFAQWPNMTGQVLAAELMGLKAAWNDEATFAYTARVMKLKSIDGSFEGQMWDKYKGPVTEIPRIDCISE